MCGIAGYWQKGDLFDKSVITRMTERMLHRGPDDAGFWLVSTFLEIDEKTTLKSWTIMETLIGVTALVVGFVISIFA